MLPIELVTNTKHIFQIFHILKTNRLAPRCNLYIEWPSYNIMAHNKPNKLLILQCFDTVGWATGRASGKKLGVGLLVVTIWLDVL